MFSECFACCFFFFRFVYCFCCYVRIYLVVVRTLRNTIGVRVYSFLHSFKQKMFVFCFRLLLATCHTLTRCTTPIDKFFLRGRVSERVRTYVCIWCVCLRMFRIAHHGRSVKNVLTIGFFTSCIILRYSVLCLLLGRECTYFNCCS